MFPHFHLIFPVFTGHQHICKEYSWNNYTPTCLFLKNKLQHTLLIYWKSSLITRDGVAGVSKSHINIKPTLACHTDFFPFLEPLHLMLETRSWLAVTADGRPRQLWLRRSCTWNEVSTILKPVEKKSDAIASKTLGSKDNCTRMEISVSSFGTWIKKVEGSTVICLWM